jgi:hypothetical protein
MSSTPGDTNRQAAQHVSPTPDDGTTTEEVSDVESFSRTRPDVSDDEEEEPEEPSHTNGTSNPPEEAEEDDDDDEEEGGDDTIQGLPGASQNDGVAPSIQVTSMPSPCSLNTY